jgi:two-component system chemotaxis sensor kinase CheA
VQLAFDVEGQEIPLALSRVLGGVLSHLLRNAVAHGIEPESERLERGKPAAGNVRVSAEAGPLGTIIRIDDDGRGFDLDTLGASGGTGANAEHAFAAALTPGVSTTPARDELSGAGVGLAAVQSELCAVGYQVELVSTSARGCSIEIAPMPRRDGRIQERHVG